MEKFHIRLTHKNGNVIRLPFLRKDLDAARSFYEEHLKAAKEAPLQYWVKVELKQGRQVWNMERLDI